MGDSDVAVLVAAATRGDEDAWGSIVERFSDVVWSVARGHGLTPADAADVSQTVWLRLAEHLDRLREPGSVGAWLATTARRESVRTLQRSSHQVLVDSCLDWCGSGSSAEIDVDLLADEEDEALWRAFDELSGPCKALLRMLMADPPPSYADVSSALDMRIGSIGPMRARCLERLRDCVEQAARQSNKRTKVTLQHGVGTRRRAS